jgi:NADPH:quinone reductase-like Zn-dependent oxidoreductase
VDVVLDALGGADWRKGYQLLAPAGMLVAFGLANVNQGGTRKLFHVLGALARVPRFSPLKMMDDNRAVAGVHIGHLWREEALLRAETNALLALFEAGKIAPQIAGRFPFSRAADAHGELEYGRNQGKILLVPE